MKDKKGLFKIIVWFIFFVTFSAEFAKIVFELNPDYGHKSLKAANAFFWSSLLLIEIVMGGLVIYYMVNYSPRRLRLFVLSLCHFSVILVLPMVFDDWSWTCLLYPWPHSLQAFDPATPVIALYISLFVGFIIVPLVTVKWGVKGFCGYICPHGAFFSETYGRIFPSRPSRLNKIPRSIPPIYFTLMVLSLVIILVIPHTIAPLRTIQKLVYFFTAEFFFFVIGVPLLGGRSYCRLMCPLGYFVLLLTRSKRKWYKNNTLVLNG
jgi:polyferredoxin